MQNELLSVMMERSSYRGSYEAKLVSKEDLESIMKVGLSAPSGCNKQTTSLIAVDDANLLQKIKLAIDPPIFKTAPAIICVLTEKLYAYRDKCYNVQNYSAVIENMLLAIKVLGYESCWYEGHITDEDNIAQKIADILSVPKNCELICILPVGYASEDVRCTKKKDFSERAWFNGYEK